MIKSLSIKPVAAMMIAAGMLAAGAAAAQTVKVDGSSTVFPITEAVAEEFQKSLKGKVKVTVSLFGRPTSVELDYLQLKKTT